jgi:hypothetical protein
LRDAFLDAGFSSLYQSHLTHTYYNVLYQDYDIVTIEVGEEKKLYRTHKALLTHYSDYFRKALQGPWAEAEDKKITLDDVEPNIFDIFVNWISTKKLPLTGPKWVLNSNGDRAGVVMIKALIFSERFLVAKFRRAVNNCFLGRYIGLSGTPSFAAVILAYESLPPNFPILQMLVDKHCMSWKKAKDGPKEI